MQAAQKYVNQVLELHVKFTAVQAAQKAKLWNERTVNPFTAVQAAQKN